MNQPYGGKLINKVVPTKDKARLKAFAAGTISIDMETAKDIRNIAVGVLSPLEGFMNEEDFVGVVEHKKLTSGLSWTIPIFLNFDHETIDPYEVGSFVLLINKDMGLEAILKVEDKYSYDPESYCENVYGTTSQDHPGVQSVFKADEVLVGGEIQLLKEGIIIFPEYNFTPTEMREKFQAKGWETIVAFQTRNPAHLAHEFIQKMALEHVDGLLIQPVMGKKKAGDFKDEVILAVYQRLTEEFYPRNATMLAIFPTRMRYAGPREAVYHAIARKNFGCTHFIVGRDHAGVGNFYDKLAAHHIFDEIGDIGMQIMKFSNAFYSHKSRMFTTEKVSPFDDPADRINPSGTEVRRLFQEKKIDDIEQFMRKEAIETILSFEKPFVE